MNTMAAFAMGEANRHRELMVFDWDEAARRIKASGCNEASAGLRDDWEYTGGLIFLMESRVPRNIPFLHQPGLSLSWKSTVS